MTEPDAKVTRWFPQPAGKTQLGGDRGEEIEPFGISIERHSEIP